MSFKDRSGIFFAIRPLVLLGYLCLMLGMFGLLTVIPLGVSLAWGTPESSLYYLAIITISLLLGWYGVSLTKNSKVYIQRNESLALVALVFIVSSLIQSIPIMSGGIPFLDAWFEAVSGVTTTGLSTLENLNQKSPAFLFSRGWMQWVGGLGIIVLALALVFQPGIVTRQLGFDSNEVEDVVGGTRSHARRILLTYALLTLAIMLALILAGSGICDSLVHAMAALSTGGFANHDDSLASVSFWERVIILGGCLAGAISFNLYYRRQFRDWNQIFGDKQFLFLVGMILFMTAMLFLSMTHSDILGLEERIEHSLWMAVSAQTTAGFATIPPQDMGLPALGLMSAAMFVGGGLGSTAGGIKLLRLMLLLRVFQLYLQRLSSSQHADIPERFMGSPITSIDIQGAVAVVLTYLGTLLISWIIFLQYGYDPLLSLFEVSSALGTSGLSAGLTGPDLDPVLKVVLIIDMLMGRTEGIAIVILLVPGNWFGKRRNLK